MKLSFKPMVLLFMLLGLALALTMALVACAGPQGPAGPAGPTGPAGPAGAAGTAGAAGAPGTSVGTIEGKVVASATGKGAEKVTVVTVPGTVSATTDAEGKFKLDKVPVGAYTVKASLAGYNTASAKVTMLAGQTAAVNLSLAAEEPFQLATLKAAGYRLQTTDTYPNSNLRMTTHYAIGGEPLTHGENLITTSGMSNAAVGGYVWLQGKDTDAAEKKITAWEWSVVGPGESTVELDNASSQTPRFKADKIGKYEITVTATNEEGKKASSELVVYASSYVGAATCVSCHSGSVMPDTASEWQQTGHATKLIDTYASYTATRDYCIACHTTGYDETDKAGGFDDMAKQAGWDSIKESLTAWLKNNNWTIDQIMASAMGKLANVQCESCHGPGQIHQGIVNAKENGTLFNPGVCSQCHPQQVQWENSGHANTGWKEIHMAEGTSCVECHTGQGFVEVKIRGKAPVFPDMATPDEPANLAEPSQQPPVACATCHDPHAFNEPHAGRYGMASNQLRLSGSVTMPSGVTVDAEESALCVTCHANKRDLAYKADYIAGKKTRGAHDNTQADNFYGATAAVVDYGQKFESSPHSTLVEEGCIQCHMAPNPKMGDATVLSVGGHSWSMAGTYNGQEVENLAACNTAGCHATSPLTSFDRTARADYDGNGKVEGVQTEVKGLLALLAKELPKDAQGNVLSSGITTTNTTEANRKALWNYWI
ncbi:MAG: carboxypeptidase-like regulatory domain-containing protein, partial [Chloroflexota bacterium]